ncbi:hypothetical protein SAMN06297144_0205 [Sphingomonas guangdongensis]|uniref:Uncharacterized protein n=1 Tax=Sphingomonas guangdongensis TaxID=1141890 RepID=A0A285QB79_9SPHN|nr:hypothetical protein [Sphingomonas guangdongensis]SOB78768.1 hypothetical protein SAMN06297144_0205 [Sphingomonas guangdongensis]
MQARLWGGVAVAVTLAVVSGWAEARRGRRGDPDRVGWVPWRTLQFAALLTALLLTSVALNG